MSTDNIELDIKKSKPKIASRLYFFVDNKKIVPTKIKGEDVFLISLDGEKKEVKILVQSKTDAQGKLKISVAKNASVTIFEERELKEKNIIEIELTVESNARVIYVTKSNNRNEKIIMTRTATVHARAELIWFDINRDGTDTTSDITTKLIGSGARAETYGIFYGDEENQFSISHITEHLAPNTHSIMETKGVLDGKSRANIKSLIKIYPSMTGCTGHERVDTLLLNKNAHIDAMPELEIGNNDVQCTHAITTTRLSPEKLFYLEGRGLDESESRKMLIEAHLNQILKKMPAGFTDLV